MILLLLIFSYLLGTIPFGLLLTRAAGLGDVRTIGSGNIGATNVMRTGKKWLGVLTLLLDMGKGFVAVWVTMYVLYTFTPTPDYDPQTFLIYIWLSIFAVVLGHVFSIWLKLKGGKGVATAMGAIFGFSMALIPVIAIVWVMTLILSRYVSVASIFTFWIIATISLINVTTPLAFQSVAFQVVLAMLISWTHRSNIKRLMNGTEPKINFKKS